MKRRDYTALLAGHNGLTTRDNSVYVPIAYDSLDQGSWYSFPDSPGLEYGEVTRVLWPGVTETNGPAWYDATYQISLAKATNPINAITQADLPYRYRDTRKVFTMEKLLTIYHRELTIVERSATLGSILKRIGDSLASVRSLPYAIRISDNDDTYFELHALEYSDIQAYSYHIGTRAFAWSVPYEDLLKTELQYGWTKC